ncbi:MAG: hypothetical protein HY690_16955 [Chloroflexi bacterium]|nr:hypothetical protein [Chloroflexota bacterium]
MKPRAGEVVASPRARGLTLAAVGVAALAELGVLNQWAFAHVALHDGGIILYGAERMASGQVPYRDFFHFFTPGAIGLLAGLYLLAGTSVGTSLLAVALLGLGIALGVALLAQAVELPPGWAALAAWLALNASITWWPTPSHHWFASLAALVGTLAGVQAVRSGSVGWSVAAGFLLAATVWFLQSRGVLVGLLVGSGIVALRRETLRPLLAGAAIAALPALVLVALVPLPTLWQALVVFPLTDYPEANRAPFLALDLLPSAPLVDEGRKQIQVLLQLGFLWLALPGLVAALALATRRRASGIALATLAGIGGVLSVLYRPLAGHFTFVAPLLVVPLVWVALQMSRQWPLARALALALAVVHVLAFAPLHEAWLVASGQTVAVPTPRGAAPIGTAVDAAAAPGALGRVASQVLARTAPGEPVFVYPTLPAYYFLLARPNPTAYDYLWPGENPPAHFQEVARDLERLRPRLVVLDRSSADFGLPPGVSEARASYELMNATFDRLYRPVLQVGFLEVLELR